MTEVAATNPSYSTTRTVTRQQPMIEKQAEDKFETLPFLPEGEARQGEGGLRTQGYFKKSQSDKPLITVITVVFNGEKFLEETILSVINQTYDNVEYIIIDGGSNVETLDIINKYDDKIDYWISEKDKGISDAFNKGIVCASGDIIGLINADDYYEQGAFSNIIDCYLDVFVKTPIIIYGQTNRITLNGKKMIKKDNQLGWYMSVPFSHCSSFATMNYYKNFGLFDNKFRIAMDVDLLMRGLNLSNYIKLEAFIATQRDGGVSDWNRLKGYKEYREVAKSHLGVVLSYFGYVIKVVVFYKNKVFK
jgi:glycosyltransferase involved in cell wall biosynthesis